MATTRQRREKRKKRERAGSAGRDAQHRGGGDWTTLTIPEGVDILSPKAKTYRWDVVPYEVKDNPYAKPGDWYWERTYYSHRGIGPDNLSYVCPARTERADCEGKRCPICDYRAELEKAGDTDKRELDALKPKERQLFLIYDRDEKEKGVQLLEFSHWCFGVLLDKVRRNADDDEVYIADFDDPEAGSALKVSFGDESVRGDEGSYSFVKVFNIDFKPRSNGLPEELLNHGICLDELLKVMDYDDLKTAFLQTEEPDDLDDDDDEPEPEKKPAKAKARKKTKTEPMKTAKELGLVKGGEVQHGDDMCEVVKISKDGMSLTLLDDKDELRKDVAVGNVIVTGPTLGTPDKSEPEPEDDDDIPFDDDDDWPEDDDDE